MSAGFSDNKRARPGKYAKKPGLARLEITPQYARPSFFLPKFPFPIGRKKDEADTSRFYLGR